MTCFRDHLLPGSVLAMPFMRLWKAGEPSEKDWAVTAEALRPEDDATIRRWSRSWFEPETALEHTEDRYDVVVDGVVVRSEHHRQSPATRAYTQDEARALYAAAGFDGVRLYQSSLAAR